jgi:hypothetical protein
MTATIVTTDNELEQIVQLSHKNMRTNISEKQQKQQGFITWNYSFQLLKQMNDQCAHIIVKDKINVVGYALVALKEASIFHNDLNTMMQHLETLQYENGLLQQYKFYVMGQICVDEDRRGKGVFQMLYQHHKKLFEDKFDFVVTEISTNNPRSLRAHEKVGFKTIYTYRDALDEWNVVLWDWK